MATDFTTMLSGNLLGHGPMHSSLVWNVSPEHGFPSGVGVGLVQALVLLTMDPPHGFSQRDHWLHSVKPPSTETTLCWWVITKFFSQCNRYTQSQKAQTIQLTNQNLSCRKTCANESQLILFLLVIGWNSGARFFSQSFSLVIQNQLLFDSESKPLSFLFFSECCVNASATFLTLNVN